MRRGGEQGVDHALHTRMLRDGYDNNGNPGIVCLLTGDGKGIHNGVGFHADLERMYQKGWKIEVLAWELSCSSKMRGWVQEVGFFVPLEEWYEYITFLEPVWDEQRSIRIPGRSALPIDETVLQRLH